MKRLNPYFVITCFILSLFFFTKELMAGPYYEGKVMTIVVGFGPGGGYDRMARLLAKYLPKYIPGRPNVIVQNMPGGASMIAANHIYNAAKPDGLTIGTFDRGIIVAQLMKAEGARFDLNKYSWIGSGGAIATLFTIRSDLPYKTFEDLRKAKNPIYIGATEAGSITAQFPTVLKEFLGLNLKIVLGYLSTTEIMLAIERKEVDGFAASYSTVKMLIDRGIVRPMIRGRVSESGIESLPVNEDLTTDKKAKTIMAMVSAVDQTGRFYAAPAGTPADVMNILRDAFAKTLQDPEVKDVALKTNLEIAYTSADELVNIINYVLNQPEEIIKEFSKYVKF